MPSKWAWIFWKKMKYRWKAKKRSLLMLTFNYYLHSIFKSWHIDIISVEKYLDRIDELLVAGNGISTLSVMCITLSYYSVGCTYCSVGCKDLLCRLYALLCRLCTLLCRLCTLLCRLYALLCWLCTLLCQLYALLCRLYALLTVNEDFETNGAP